MHVVHPICCGLDVHPAAVVACLCCVGDDGQMRLERREYGTTHRALLTLGAWLLAEHCPIVAMESTGVYWHPVSNWLAGHRTVLLVQVAHVKHVPGRKTAKADAR
jgi:transposase